METGVTPLKSIGAPFRRIPRRRRPEYSRCSAEWGHFLASESSKFTDAQPFDALVGRFILMYLPDPVATLKLLSRQLRSGAAIAFCEPDYTVLSTVVPEIPLLRQCEEWLREAFRRSGARVDMGMRLYQTSGMPDLLTRG